jgi:hypothetical protein
MQQAGDDGSLHGITRHTYLIAAVGSPAPLVACRDRTVRVEGERNATDRI